MFIDIMGIREDLLAKILQIKTPCPIVCENNAPYGTGVYDIKTGLELVGEVGGGSKQIIADAILVSNNIYLQVGNNEYLRYT